MQNNDIILPRDVTLMFVWLKCAHLHKIIHACIHKVYTCIDKISTCIHKIYTYVFTKYVYLKLKELN